MYIQPKAIYRFKKSLSKFEWHFSRHRKTYPTIYLEQKIPQMAKAIFRKKSKAGGLTLSGFKLYNQALSSKQYGVGMKVDNGSEQRTQT